MLKPHLVITLLKLAELEIDLRNNPITTSFLAKKLHTSQQTVSRHLIELEKLRFITRSRKNEGEIIIISKSGLTELGLIYLDLKKIFDPSIKKIIFRGQVFTGLGEGAYYVSQEIYVDQFIKKLGFKPYPGTLNIRLQKKSMKERVMLEALKPIVIHGFITKGRKFGPVNCLKATVNNIEKCALIEAHRTHYQNDVLEIISAYNLRRYLELQDGDEVRVMIFSNLR